LNTSQFVEPRTIRWKSFDALEISGFYYRPPTDFKGKRPVIIDVHGGPASQARAGFIGRNNYFLNELGIAVIYPNVRGSAGFGKSFLLRDNGRRREDSVKDLGALIDWIQTQPDLDGERILVVGGSYGGYMALAASVLLADRISGAISRVGISNFVTFLERTETYRRDHRRREYGDERNPAMRKFLESIAPVNRADAIRKPLFVVHGLNDPRVPYAEAERIVATVKKAGTPVWFLMAKNEGHGFSRRDNADFLFAASVEFARTTLLR
jgi:dipeptidyl aminopeptidase/acylaminoacyl peptidase